MLNSIPLQSVNADDAPALAALQRKWRWIAAVYSLLIVIGFVVLRSSWPAALAARWAVLSAAVLARELWLLHRQLPSNRPSPDATLLPTLGYGNILTLVRGVVVGLLAGFIGLPRPLGWLAWLPAILYTIGAITDHLDGYIARITDHVTGLGETLDMEFDVIGIFAAVLLAISYGQLPYWYLVIGFARELYLLGHWVLRRRGRPIYDLTPSADRRLIAGMQMGFLSVILWPLLTAPVTTVAAVMFAIPMVVSFGRDWLITTGVTSAQSPRYLLARRISKSVLQQWGPLWARLLGATALATLWQRLLHRGELWPPVGSEQPTLTVALILIGLIAGAGFCLGAVGRLCALVLVALLLIDVSVSGYSLVPHGLLLVAALYVLQFGSGRLALWQPEEALLRRRAGEESDDMPA